MDPTNSEENQEEIDEETLKDIYLEKINVAVQDLSHSFRKYTDKAAIPIAEKLTEEKIFHFVNFVENN